MRKLVFIFLLTGLIACKKDQTQVTVVALTSLHAPYGGDPAHRMDLYLPAGRSADTTKLLVMIHGGAWISGDKSEFNSYIPRIQQLLPGYAIANVNYRLASSSGNFFPAQENDIRSAIQFLLQERNTLKFTDKIVVLGASAGGHLGALYAYKHNPSQVKAVVNFFGPTDMTALYNSYTSPSALQGMQILLGGTPSSNPAMYAGSSPLNFVTAQSPPTIIFHGELDEIVPVSQAILLREKLQSKNVPHQLEIYPYAGHDIWPDAVMNHALDKMKTFIHTHVQ